MDIGSMGSRVWAMAEGYIPKDSHGPSPEMESHDTICLLNTGCTDADVSIMIYFSDREPIGPYKVIVPARRTLHQRVYELSPMGDIPKGKDYSIVVISDVPVVAQYTRLDSRQAENALISSLFYPC